MANQCSVWVLGGRQRDIRNHALAPLDTMAIQSPHHVDSDHGSCGCAGVGGVVGKVAGQADYRRSVPRTVSPRPLIFKPGILANACLGIVFAAVLIQKI